ncbi:uncharacterized protein LOC130638275 [Hydractinia symbiolongicarpus]|uniref:uncharacterized protein LOC130638275 n=1 Tax=Hydractinia symbiolongicarpus TaxID=13093 RepID=UPI00254F4B90|nr:uncharacterized protein LOC130638275 [Hydractinia symbiolongicarpus]
MMSMLVRKNPEWLSGLLKQNSFTHESYYKEIRHNHKPHGICALAYLGFSEERTRSYINELNKHIPELKADKPFTERALIDYVKSVKLIDYRGKNNGFYAMKEKYEDLLKNKYNGDVIKMIKDVAPAIIDGPLYSAFHGIISIAYGYLGNSPETMLEGLIFMDQQYSPMLSDQPDHHKRKDLSNFGRGKTNILDIFQKLHDNKELVKELKEEEEKDKEFRVDTHMAGVYGWPAPKYHGEYFLDMADDIQFPEWFDPEKEDLDQLFRVVDWFGDNAVVVYVKAETKNDFFLLHGITGSWSYRQICHLFDYKTALRGLRALVAGLLAVYMTQQAPALSRSPEEFFEGEVNQAKWDAFMKELLEDETNYEMHALKVIQCCYEFWLKRPEMGNYYYAAAVIAKRYFFSFGDEVTFPNNDLSA